MTSDQPPPAIRLLPKKSPKRFRHGAPWIFADELVLDRRTRGIAAGTVVEVQDADRNPFALAGFNASSKIAARLLSLDPNGSIDENWIRQKIAFASSMRATLFDNPFYRLVHAEADGLPGLIIDRFGDCFVVQPNSAWADRALPQIVAALKAEFDPSTIIKNASGRSRALEGLDDVSSVLHGTPDGPIPVQMNGATYMADVLEGQKTGLFFDQRDNHAFAAKLAHGKTVLDVFSHVGGFSLAALAAGATNALAIDGSAPALDLASAGAKASGLADRFTTLQGDAVSTMQALLAEERTFDVVICDPPAFAPRREALTAGLRGYERVALNAAKLVAPGGFLGLCSCSGAVDIAAFRTACVTGIGRAGRSGQVLHMGAAAPDHPTHPQLDETAYLKAIFLRLNA